MADPDIFISYSHANHDIAERLAHVFEEAGHTVWWDRELDAGSRFRAEIQQNLDTARVVVVIWTAASVESDWVLGEAATARDRRTCGLPPSWVICWSASTVAAAPRSTRRGARWWSFR